MARRRKKLRNLRFLPPSKIPAAAVHELILFASAVYGSRKQLLENWCICNARGYKHDFCLAGRAEAIGKMMGWDYFVTPTTIDEQGR